MQLFVPPSLLGAATPRVLQIEPAELLSVLPAAVPAVSGVSLESLQRAIDRCVVEL
ncbi:MAG: hypothetical protein ACK56U_21170 [Planctomyces sp.]